METKHLSYFKVENFKRFDSLEVSDIGQFNLIVGDNNVGKTSFLEALLFDENPNQFLKNIWTTLTTYRHINISDGSTVNYLDFYLNNKEQPLEYNYKYESSVIEANLSLIKKLKRQLTLDEIEKLKETIILHPGSTHLIQFSLNGKTDLKFISYGAEVGSSGKYIPFISFNTVYADDMLEFFSKISISSTKLEILVNDLKYFIHNIISIEINNAIVPKTSVIAIREAHADLRPLSQYGDGVIKLFRYLLELDLCENKRIMIDEIDTGIHYSRMKDFLKKVMKTAKNKNVQIFATTHSKECLEYFTEALVELGFENDGRIIKLADTKKGIKAYTMKFEEFENAMSAESEIR